jgi:hypothetical protein
MSDFWYLATPYSKYPKGLEAAYRLAYKHQTLLHLNHIKCFSPIAFCHHEAMALGLDPHDHSIWLPVCAPIMALAKGLIIVKAGSWEISYGIKQEWADFDARGLPVIRMDPFTMPTELL